MRSCEGCTKCCEGWLWGKAYDHDFWPGRPCHFMNKEGCSIYNNRPETPCKSFKCEWLINDKLPEWFKPNIINAIIYKRIENGKEYIEITEAGSKLDAKVLSWFFMEYARGNFHNIKYQLDGGWNYITKS
jgi:uncharacterized cysteine cluster protein YcgN (CxxCxxCC family)